MNRFVASVGAVVLAASMSMAGESRDGVILDGVGKNPRFVDAANGDYRPKSNSPLRDAGRSLAWMTEEAVDLEGNPRCLAKDGKPYPDALPDIGCYECAIPAPGLMLLVW